VAAVVPAGWTQTTPAGGTFTVPLGVGMIMNGLDFGVLPGHVTPGQFVINAPASTTAGVPLSITVTAQNGSGAPAFGYTGTVPFTTSAPGAAAFSPADYTSTLADEPSHTFTNAAALVTAGSQTITATDTTSAATGAGAVTVLPLAANHFQVTS